MYGLVTEFPKPPRSDFPILQKHAARPNCVIASCVRPSVASKRLSKSGRFTNRFRVVQICRIGVIHRSRRRHARGKKGIDTSSNRMRNVRGNIKTFQGDGRGVIGLDTLLMSKGHADCNYLEIGVGGDAPDLISDHLPTVVIQQILLRRPTDVRPSRL